MSDELPERLLEALADRYRIEHKLGEGGMATVWLAEDLKHERRVAVKVLRSELAALLGAERFLSEIKTTANLQHPHILPLFDSGQAGGFLYYVMPYIEGESLRERLDRDKQLSVEESVRIARTVAGALQAAHEAGVIHRDVKPENILLSRGEPLVSDFGIALAVTQAGGGRITETGLSLGTPYYMSPEQATADRDPGRASDVYSLGCVLYEMLVGDPPHTGSSAQAVLAKILTEEPRSVTALRRTVPVNVADAVARALERLPADRFESADAFARALGDPGFRHVISGAHTAASRAPDPSEADGPQPALAHPAARFVPWAVAAAATLVAVFALTRTADRAATGPLQLVMDMGANENPRTVVISADGRTFATLVLGSPTRAIHVRTADNAEWRKLDGTEGAGTLGLSPDGSRVAFTRDGALLTVSTSGGGPLTVVPKGQGGIWDPHWGPTGDIVYVGPRGVMRVPANGGVVDTFVADVRAADPHLLPDGSAILFTSRSGAGAIGIVDVASDSSWTLIPEGVAPRYLESGHILYGHPDGGLLLQAFDARRTAVSGAPLPVLDGVYAYDMSLSLDGTLVYRSGTRWGARQTRFLLLGADGAVDTLRMPLRSMFDARLSPDGARMAFSLSDREAESEHVYLYDVERRAGPTQLTFEGLNFGPRWSADGTRVAYTSERDDSTGIYVKSVDGDQPPELLFGGSEEQFPLPDDWTADGLVVFAASDAATSRDLLTIPEDGGEAPSIFLQTDFSESSADVSPDGRWLAYASSEAGGRDVYVRAFPGAQGQRRVSASGSGSEPRWSPDGRRLYYANYAGDPDTVLVVDVQMEPTFSVSSPEVVWVGQLVDYDVHPDGARVLIAERVLDEDEDGEPEPTRIVVVLDWFDLIRDRLEAAGR